MKSIRKKAFWRAYRRKEITAITAFQDHVVVLMSGQYRLVVADKYCPPGQVFLLWEKE